MWCPKCRNEYIEGITACSDCGVSLVPSLTDEDSEELLRDDGDFPETEAFPDAGDSPEAEAFPDAGEAAEEDVSDMDDSSSGGAAPYISKAAQREDMKSTAYAFTFVGALGLVLLALFATGVLPIAVADSSRIMIDIVMGAVFVIFLVIGIRSFGQLKRLKEEAVLEEALSEEITEWFRQTYTKEQIDASVDTEGSEETLYFARYEVMKQFITKAYPSLEASFLDHMIETLYTELF